MVISLPACSIADEANPTPASQDVSPEQVQNSIVAQLTDYYTRLTGGNGELVQTGYELEGGRLFIMNFTDDEYANAINLVYNAFNNVWTMIGPPSDLERNQIWEQSRIQVVLVVDESIPGAGIPGLLKHIAEVTLGGVFDDEKTYLTFINVDGRTLLPGEFKDDRTAVFQLSFAQALCLGRIPPQDMQRSDAYCNLYSYSGALGLAGYGFEQAQTYMESLGDTNVSDISGAVDVSYELHPGVWEIYSKMSGN